MANGQIVKNILRTHTKSWGGNLRHSTLTFRFMRGVESIEKARLRGSERNLVPGNRLINKVREHIITKLCQNRKSKESVIYNTHSKTVEEGDPVN